MKPQVLIVEDDEAIEALLAYNLEKEGYRISVARDGEDAILQVSEDLPDLIILDWMLPKLSGIEVCRRIRARPNSKNVPIMMLTARIDESDRIRGLDVGADDYLVKPFSVAELKARIRAIMRRIRPALADEIINYQDLTVDKTSHRVTRGGVAVHLGPTEFKLLCHLIEHPQRVFSREQLLDAVWGNDVYVEIRTVDVHIGRLRKSINLPNMPDLIRTIRASGYSLDAKN